MVMIVVGSWLTLAACGHTDSHGYAVPATVTPFPAVALPTVGVPTAALPTFAGTPTPLPATKA